MKISLFSVLRVILLYSRIISKGHKASFNVNLFWKWNKYLSYYEKQEGHLHKHTLDNMLPLKLNHILVLKESIGQI